jgi:transposase-like protein
MVSFKGAHFEKDLILTCVRWYVVYPLSYRQLEEMMQERGVSVDHSTINRWVLKYTPGVEHRQHRYLNNRAENSHQPTRQRERRMQGFKSPGHAQRFLSAYGPIAQHFRPRRHLLSASAYRQEMRRRCDSWQTITNLPTAA